MRTVKPQDEECLNIQAVLRRRSRGGFSTKIQITVDGLGNPLRARLTAGPVHASAQAEASLAEPSGQQ